MGIEEQQDIRMKYVYPAIALDYLRFKKEYEGKNFLRLWNDIIPYYFSAEDFCDNINTLRVKRIGIASMGKEQSKKAFDIAFDDLLRDKIKDKHIDQEEFRKLVGTLMSVYNSSKFKEFTENYTQNIMDILDKVHIEKDDIEQKKKNMVNKRIQKQSELETKNQEKMEKELFINKELFDIYNEFQTEFLNNKEVGYKLVTEDKEAIFDDAWAKFKLENIGKFSENTLKKIKKAFFGSYIY